MEPNFSHDVVEERHDGDPAKSVSLLQLGKQHRCEIAPALLTVKSSLSDPGSSEFLTPGSEIRERFFRIPDPQPIIL
jgi:hypothetical protein